MGHLTNAAAQAACNAVVDLVDGGTGAGDIIIYSGTVPTDADTALAGNTVLVTIACETTAFGAAADSTGEATSDLALGSGKSATASATGTATFYRILDGDSTVIWQGTVGTSSSDLVITNTSITSGDTVSITDLEFRIPEAITNYTPS